MAGKTCILIGAPVDSGKRNRGCLMGPDAYRTAGLAEALSDLGFRVRDMGNLAQPEPLTAAGPDHVHAYGSTCAWTHRLERYDAHARTRTRSAMKATVPKPVVCVDRCRISRVLESRIEGGQVIRNVRMRLPRVTGRYVRHMARSSFGLPAGHGSAGCPLRIRLAGARVYAGLFPFLPLHPIHIAHPSQARSPANPPMRAPSPLPLPAP